MKLIFRAFDGKDFESELECKAYEERLNKVNIRIYTTAGNGEEMLIGIDDDITEFVNRVFPTHKNGQIFVNARPLRFFDGNTISELGLEDKNNIRIHVIRPSGTTA